MSFPKGKDDMNSLVSRRDSMDVLRGLGELVDAARYLALEGSAVAMDCASTMALDDDAVKGEVGLVGLKLSSESPSRVDPGQY